MNIPEWTQSVWKKERQFKKKIKIFVLIIFASVSLHVLVSYKFEYDRQNYLRAQAYEYGCVWHECPQDWIDDMLEENNGLYPPSHYERNTKMWWRSYCTYTANLPDSLGPRFKCG